MMLRRVVPFVLVVACADPQGSPDPTSLVTETPAMRAMALGATPLSVDDRGRPRLMQVRAGAIARAATPTASAKLHVERLASAWGVPATAVPVLEPVGEVRTRGGTIARLQPVIDGLPVEGGELRMLMRASGELVTASGTLVGTDAPRSAATFVDDEAGAIARALEHAYGAPFDRAGLRTTAQTGLHAGASAQVHVSLARARKIWHQQDAGLVAGWVVETYASKAGSEDAFRTLLAADGSVLAHRSIVVDAFDYRVFAETTGEKHPKDGPIADVTPHPTGVPNGTFPGYIAPSTVRVEGLNDPVDPWLVAGATETSGNNVDAYTDVEQPSGFSPGDFRANVTSPGVFAYSYNTAAEPMVSVNQQKASVVSLFYGINWLHDFWYDAGFTEAAGNAQAVNYGRGGVEGDAILAEAQDNANGGSRNNANMATPSDGMPPRMQVFLWTGKDDRTLRLAPSNRMPPTGSAAFGPKSFDLVASVALASPIDACTTLTAPQTGKIVLVDRGTCSFKLKALNVQNAGGAGMLLANNAPGDTPPGMGGDAMVPETITIASLSVTQAEGAQIKADLAGAVTATMHRLAGVELDGGLDSTLIAHEFGHYVHHRLSQCDTRMCAAISEGWGDFLALMLMARDGDNYAGAYPFSIYTTQSFTADAAYFGIRRAPYSINAAINSLSFRHVSEGEPLPTSHPFLGAGNNSEVHNAGEVWAAALWQGYAALLQAGPFVEARQRMAEYVVAGLLMTPVDATFTEARDAILAAAHAASPADHDLLARGFADRGLGSCAISPGRESADFVGVVESTEVKGRATPGAPLIADSSRSCDDAGILDGGETARISFPIANPAATAVANVQVSLESTTPGITVIGEPVMIPSLAAYQSQDLSFEIQLDNSSDQPVAAELSIIVSSPGICFDSVPITIPLRMNVDDRAEQSTMDRFDAVSTLWVPASTGPNVWAQSRTTALNGHWHGTDVGTLTDSALVSPVLTGKSGARQVLAFQHRYSFESGGGMNFDGGVVEVSVAGGDWMDISTYADPGYTGELTDVSGNPLALRMAFTGANEGYPEFTKVTLDLGTSLAGKSFQLRYRIGTDQAAGGPGWDLDEVELKGIVGTPFPAQAADDTECKLPGDKDDDGGCCEAGPLRPQTAMLAIGMLALLLRRRRR
ncbi:MAG: M36 family metallopeptidase [Kofleriaceae bacterium]